MKSNEVENYKTYHDFLTENESKKRERARERADEDRRNLPTGGSITAVGSVADSFREFKGLLVVLGAIAYAGDSDKLKKQVQKLIPSIQERHPDMANLLQAVIDGDSRAAWRHTKSEIGYKEIAGKGLVGTILEGFSGSQDQGG